MAQQLILLNLFCGKRRDDDIQCAVEYQTQLYGVCLFVLSIAIAINQVLGDLGHAAALRHWLRLATAGQIFAVFAGPPCESWTAARHNQKDIADKKKLPRQISSAKEL